MLINLKSNQKAFDDIVYHLSLSGFRQYDQFKYFLHRSYGTVSRAQRMLNYCDSNELLFKYISIHYKNHIELTP